MERPKIDSVVEGIITYLLKKKTSYRHIQRELKGQGHDISIATIHRVKHLKGKTCGSGCKKAKIGPYKRTPHKSTPGVIREVAIMIKRVNPPTQREMATQLGVSQSTIHRIIKIHCKQNSEKSAKFTSKMLHKLKNDVNVHGSFINV